MAKIIPSHPSAWSLKNHAEGLLHQKLKHELDDQFLIFYSLRFQSEPDRKKGIDREIDFLIIHPNYGFLVLEVKGGTIEHLADNVWRQTSKSGEAHPLKDPIEQVLQEMYAVRNFLQSQEATKAFIESFMFHRAVWFPDCRISTPLNLPGLSNECILDNKSLEKMEAAIVGAFRGSLLKQPLSTETMKAIEDTLASKFTLSRSIESHLTIDAERVKMLTDQQFMRLEQMQDHVHLLIPGGAGTGKTILAYETAWRLAKKGKRVLLLSYTRFQAEWLERELTATGEKDAGVQLDITDIGTLVEHLATQAKLPSGQLDEIRRYKSRIDSVEGQEKLAMYLSAAVKKLPSRANNMWQYDAIIVDEGQDFESALWAPLRSLRRDVKLSIFYVFYDEAQRIDFPKKWEHPFPQENIPAFPLSVNCRNAPAIYSLMQYFSPSPPSNFVLKQDTMQVAYCPVLYANYDSKDEAIRQVLRLELQRLVDIERVLLKDILIITCRAKISDLANHQSQFKTWKAPDFYPIAPITKPLTASHIRYSTIRSSKGLESKVVVLMELDGMADEKPEKHHKLVYTAISRAKHHLLVLGTFDELQATPSVK